MSVLLYDTALVFKLKQWTPKTDCHMFGPQDTKKLFEISADMDKDNRINLPIVAVKHSGGYSLNNTNKRVLTYDGIHINDASGEKVSTINAVPITIPYQIDIYTRYQDQADEYVRNFVFNIINHPTMTIDIPYGGHNFKHNANIRLSSADIQDNSDIPEAIISGSFVRMTLSINIDDAYLWSIPSYKTLTVDGIEIDLGWSQKDTIIETITI